MWDTLSKFIPPLRWVLVVVVLTAVFAITQIPASWAAYFMTQGNTLALSGVTGTAWSGQARMSSIEIDNQHYSLGALQWQLRPMTLLTLRPCADVDARLEGQQIEGRACAGLSGRLDVTDASIDAPASLVQAGVPVPVQGQLSANLQTLKMKNQKLSELRGNLSWTNARVQVEGTWASLGSFAAEATYDPEQDALVADVFELDGPIDLDAEVRLPLAGGIFVKGELALTDAFSNQIQAREWLPMVLDHQSGNRYNVDLQF
jgi:general secretion pathway protein N